MGTTTVVDALGFGSRYVSNWVNKPASLPNAFTDLLFIKDVGVGGSYWYWDDGTSGAGGGTPRYRSVGGQVILSAISGSISALTKVVTSVAAQFFGTGGSDGLVLPTGLMQKGDIAVLETTVSVNSASTVNMQFTAKNSADSYTASYLEQTASALVANQAYTVNHSARLSSDSSTLTPSNVGAAHGWGSSSNTGANVAIKSALSSPIIFDLMVSATLGGTLTMSAYTLTLKTCGS